LIGGFIGNKPVSRPKLNEICNVRIDRKIPRFGRIFVLVIDANNKTPKYANSKNNAVKKKISEEKLSITKLPGILELSVESKNKINKKEIDIKPIQGRNSRNLARLGYTRN
jgi:hypothetical protein